MSGSGSCSELAGKVAAALLEQGATNLEAKIGSYIASFGDTNWQTDSKLSKAIPKDRWGAHYHRESIGRARRMLTRAGFLHVKRIMPGVVPPGADYPAPHGTTSKGIRWKAVGVTRPPKSERRQMAQQAKALERHERLAKPRHTAPGAIVGTNPIDSTGRAPKSPTPDPELASLLLDFVSTQQSARARRGTGEEQKPVPRQGPDPPD
jgi:hypothetical protein